MPNIFVICSNDEFSRCVYLTVFNSSIPEYSMISEIYACTMSVKSYCCDHKHDKHDKSRYGCKIKIKGIASGLWG